MYLYRLLGKAAFQLGEQSQAEAAYRKALDVNPSALLAWKGLSELLTSQSPDSPAYIETQSKLVRTGRLRWCGEEL